MSELTISGDGDDWAMFSRTPAGGPPIFIRSRTGVPDVREYAEKNFFSRLRCSLPKEGTTDQGLPKSTEALDKFEDELLKALAAANAQTYLLAVTTGHGSRDFYFSAADAAELPNALKSIEAERPFTTSLAKGEPAMFLKMLTLSQEDQARATFHGVQPQSGGMLGKLFKR